MIELDCFYSLSSPWAYLAGPRLEDIVRRHRVELNLKPFDFQAIVPTTGGVPLRSRPEPRRRYHELELDRWRRYHGMPLVLKPRHYPQVVTDPDWNKHAGFMVIAATVRQEPSFRLSHALLRALWAEERDIADPAVRCAVADECGLDGSALLAAERSDQVQALYKQYTEEALVLGVFGAPTFIVGGELFWGQDRLGFVDRKLYQMRAATEADAIFR